MVDGQDFWLDQKLDGHEDYLVPKPRDMKRLG